MKVVTAFLLILTTSFSALAQDEYYHCSNLPQPETYVDSNFSFENEIVFNGSGIRISEGTKLHDRSSTSYVVTPIMRPDDSLFDRTRITPRDQFVITSELEV